MIMRDSTEEGQAADDEADGKVRGMMDDDEEQDENVHHEYQTLFIRIYINKHKHDTISHHIKTTA